MSIEQFQPKETDEQARTKVGAMMLLRFAQFERSGLEGLFERFNQEDNEDEV